MDGVIFWMFENSGQGSVSLNNYYVNYFLEQQIGTGHGKFSYGRTRTIQGI